MVRSSSFFALFSLFLVLLIFSGCVSYTDLPPGTVLAVSGSPVIEQEEISVPLLAAEEPPLPDYVVGPGDVLFVNVNGRPELGSPGSTGGPTRIPGSRIDGAGNLRLPLVGSFSMRPRPPSPA